MTMVSLLNHSSTINPKSEHDELDYDENFPEELEHKIIVKPPPSETAVQGAIQEDDPKEGEHEPAQVREDLEDGEVTDSEDDMPKIRRSGDPNSRALFRKLLDEDEGLLEEGEEDGDDAPGVCQYFLRGYCTWGDTCKYFHPADTENGCYEFMPHRPNREILDAKPLSPPFYNEFESEPIPPEFDNQVSQAWAKGLKNAKNLMRQSKQKRETDIDFEQRKMLAGVVDEDLDPIISGRAKAKRKSQSPVEEDDLPSKPVSRPPHDEGSIARAVARRGASDAWEDPWQRSNDKRTPQHTRKRSNSSTSRSRSRSRKRRRSGSSSRSSSRSRSRSYTRPAPPPTREELIAAGKPVKQINVYDVKKKPQQKTNTTTTAKSKTKPGARNARSRSSSSGSSSSRSSSSGSSSSSSDSDEPESPAKTKSVLKNTKINSTSPKSAPKQKSIESDPVSKQDDVSKKKKLPDASSKAPTDGKTAAKAEGKQQKKSSDKSGVSYPGVSNEQKGSNSSSAELESEKPPATKSTKTSRKEALMQQLQAIEQEIAKKKEKKANSKS